LGHEASSFLELAECLIQLPGSFQLQTARKGVAGSLEIFRGSFAGGTR
jgi:hypothetical protein